MFIDSPDFRRRKILPSKPPPHPNLPNPENYHYSPLKHYQGYQFGDEKAMLADHVTNALISH